MTPIIGILLLQLRYIHQTNNKNQPNSFKIIQKWKNVN